ncbi:MAG: cell division protein FtsA [Nanoarchaeota archaeon]|nr:cell division protein FtsA [Nanoarchaeota archaeon]
MSKILTCLDMGSSQIKGIVTERAKNGSVSVVAAFRHPSQGFRRGVIADVEDARETLGELMEELKHISKEAPKNIFVNINSEHVKARVSRGISAVSQPDREIRKEDVERAVQSSRAAKMIPNYKVLHTIIREFLVDDIPGIQDPVGMSGSRLEVSTLLIEAFAPHFDMLGKTLEDAGGAVSGVVFNPFASSRSTLTKKQKELGVLMVDIGSGTTSIVAFEEMKPLYARSLPIGAGHVTNDIAIGLKIPIDVAERIKLQYGTADPRKTPKKDTVHLYEFDPGLREEVSRKFVNEIIEVRIAEILDILNNELQPLRERFEFPAGVVLTGGGVKLEGITELVRTRLKLPAQIGIPDLSRIEIPNPTYERMMDDPEFAVAVGLVAVGWHEEPRPRGLFQAGKNILKNFMP